MLVPLVPLGDDQEGTRCGLGLVYVCFWCVGNPEKVQHPACSKIGGCSVNTWDNSCFQGLGGFHALTDMSGCECLGLGPASADVFRVALLRWELIKPGLYPALWMAASTSFLSSLSSTPMSLSLRSVSWANKAGVLQVLYLYEINKSDQKRLAIRRLTFCLSLPLPSRPVHCYSSEF